MENILYYPEEIPSYLVKGSAEEARFLWEAGKVFCEGLDTHLVLDRIRSFLGRYLPVDVVSTTFIFRNSVTANMFWAGDIPDNQPTEVELFYPPENLRNIFSLPDSSIWLFNSDSPRYTARLFHDLLQGGEWSIMFIRMFLEKKDVVGYLTVGARGYDKYSLSHASILHSLGEPTRLFLVNAYQHMRDVERNRMLTKSNRLLRNTATAGRVPLTDLPGMREVSRQIVQVAPQNCPVLIVGETGVGKEVVADAVHERSLRAQAPFIKANCGAIPENLVDSELFGHEKGAFTSALTTRTGRFERAHKGTLLLDEIGELPLLAQARLLRVLQYGEFDRVGGSKTINVDVRLLAATNADLPARIAEGSFREDLFYRLNVFPIIIPPLRSRIEDIPILARAVLRHLAEEARTPCPALEERQMDRLCSHAWPGNARELKNVLEQAFILWLADPDAMLTVRLPGDIPFPASYLARTGASPKADQAPFLTLDEIMDDHIRKALRTCKGRVNGPNGAAALLGVHHSTLRSRMDKRNIPYGQKAAAYWREG